MSGHTAEGVQGVRLDGSHSSVPPALLGWAVSLVEQSWWHCCYKGLKEAQPWCQAALW